jgi:hypothetical protein
MVSFDKTASDASSNGPGSCDRSPEVAHAAQIDMMPALDTNGALLTQGRIEALADASLEKVCFSVDAASGAVHDSNRGIPGLSDCIRRANAELKRQDYAALPGHLRALGFGAVTFSYPLRTLPSSYLACAEDSPLVDFTRESGVGVRMSSKKGSSRSPKLTLTLAAGPSDGIGARQSVQPDDPSMAGKRRRGRAQAARW